MSNVVKIKKCSEDAILPTRAHDGDAGYDLYASPFGEKKMDDCVAIMPHGSTLFHTGVAMAIPDGYVGLVFARSGLGINEGLTPRNCVGVIDSNYRGEIMVRLRNDGEGSWQQIIIGERIAQIVIVPYYQYELDVVDELSDTDRGKNGFGSTGTK